MKKTGRVLFETTLKGNSSRNAILEAKGIATPIKITIAGTSTPKTNEWLAEQMMLNYASSAFMKTFLIMADKNNVPVSGFECDAIGDATLKNKVPEINCINIYPKIYVSNTSSLEAAKKLIEASIKNNPAEKMFPALISYHPVLEIKAMAKEIQMKKREVFF